MRDECAQRGTTYETTFRLNDDTWLRAKGEVVATADGTRHLVEFAQDVTREVVSTRGLRQDRDIVESALEAANLFSHALFETSPLPTWLYDPQTLAFVDVNTAALTHYGYSRDEFLSMRVLDLSADATKECTAVYLDISAAKAPLSAHLRRHRRKDGAVIEVEVLTKPTTVADRLVILGIGLDVTGRGQLEGQLLESQKMGALGRLAGGVAHDFNNLLAIILTTADCALARLDEAEAAKADVREIARAAQRGAELTRQLLTFSRRQVVQPRVIALDAVLHQLERMLRRVIREDIYLIVGPCTPASIAADRMQIEQVIMNLVVNARDAMPDGGEIEISMANVDIDATRAVELGLREGPHVELTVGDTGVGMDEETSRRIFEPFFTTKDVGKGTGLGLSTVFGVVKQCGGAIAVKSTLGFGSRFSIWLPRVNAAAALSDRPAELPSRTTEKATVLVVEDDDQLRAVICRILSEAGFTTLEAPDGPSAIRRLDRLGTAADLLVTDLVMPGMDGHALVTRMRQRWPEMGVLYMSGYDELSASRAVAPVRVDRDDAFLRKPFTAEQIRAAVDATLRGKRLRR